MCVRVSWVKSQFSNIKQDETGRLGSDRFWSGLLWHCPVLKCHCSVLKVRQSFSMTVATQTEMHKIRDLIKTFFSSKQIKCKII